MVKGSLSTAASDAKVLAFVVGGGGEGTADFRRWEVLTTKGDDEDDEGEKELLKKTGLSFVISQSFSAS